MAGVDFDNPVGSGTGLYNDHQLFEAPMNHASLVPVIGLMKLEDYCPAEPAAPQLTSAVVDLPQKPRRQKQRKDSFTDKQPSPASPTVSALQQHMSDLLLPDQKAPPVAQRSEERTPPGAKAENSISSYSVHKSEQRADTTDNRSQKSAGRPAVNGDASYSSTLEIGSMVECSIDGLPRFGVIRWIGHLDTDEHGEPVAGIELDEECSNASDGTWNGQRYFSCAARKGYFVPLSQCKEDSRFNWDRRRSALFGSIDCPSVQGDVAPLTTADDLAALCGKNRGIQGHHNSCYLDATLFAMFSCTTIFESLLHRPPSSDDIAEYREVQRVLKEEIVNPLRANMYVRADRVMHLRTLLEKLSSVRGLTSE